MIDGVYRVLERGEHQVRFDRRIDQPVAKVWAALTDPAVLRNWLGDVEIAPRAGGKFILDFRGQERPARSRRSSRSARSPTPGPRKVLCRLVLTHNYLASMTREDIGPVLAGWHAFLDVVGRGAAGEFVPYQDEGALRVEYGAKYLEV